MVFLHYAIRPVTVAILVSTIMKTVTFGGEADVTFDPRFEVRAGLDCLCVEDITNFLIIWQSPLGTNILIFCCFRLGG